MKRARRNMLDAWRMLIEAQGEDDVHDMLVGLPLDQLFFCGLASAYERADIYPPVCGVLHALRETVDGWANSHSGSTQYASVPFADLTMLSRRLDIAMEIVRRTSRPSDRGEEPTPKKRPARKGGGHA